MNTFNVGKIDTCGQFYQHAYKHLLLEQMLWRSTFIPPIILHLTLPTHSARSNAQLLRYMLYAMHQ